MKFLILAMIFILLFPAFTEAGVIYGKITKSGRSIGANVKVEIYHIRTETTYPGKTNNLGVYRINVPHAGDCKLTIKGGSFDRSMDVTSFRDSNKVDVVIYRDKKGVYQIKRK
ncbi:MAG: carboxypeptidase regulatory-like domain-containing protein [FCB group bacterium]|nr:carboxypeptidase regulatory-like domain-containing protein [FCB group bacterium]